MKKSKSLKRLQLTLPICAVFLSIGGVFLFKNKDYFEKSEHFVQDKEAFERLIDNSSQIQKLWIDGEDSKEWSLIKKQCLEYYQLNTKFDESLLRCNPMLLQCNGLFNKKLNYHFVKPDLGKDSTQKLYRYISKSNSGHVNLDFPGYLFTIEDNKSHQRLDLLLTDRCHEVFLEKRIYAYGEEIVTQVKKEIEDYRFDNFNQNIYIDGRLVLNSEVNEWIDFGNPNFTKGLKKEEKNNLFLPATKLTFNQMQNYCSFKEKQIMQAHYFDAATFLPMDLDDTTPSNSKRSPYYWTKKKSEFKADCSLLFTEDCLKGHVFYMNSTGPSWAGVFDSMGGVLEVFRNPIDPESNLKASSYYFNFKSPWHKLGFRAGWDGEGFTLRNFNFKEINPEGSIDQFDVGFRCMRESL
jgi:hypothetical protein